MLRFYPDSKTVKDNYCFHVMHELTQRRVQKLTRRNAGQDIFAFLIYARTVSDVRSGQFYLPTPCNGLN